MQYTTRKEHSDTDAELARCIKSRLRAECAAFSFKHRNTEAVKNSMREYMIELVTEIINEDF